MSTPHVWDAKTHVGAVRTNNEDCFVVDPDRGLFVVCDGMGGHARGEVASSTACATIRERIAAWPPSPHLRVARELLVGAIRAANRRVARLGTGERRPGTTVAAILWARDRFVVAHVGDSRVYRLRRGALVQLTRDHTLANELVDQGRLQPDEAAHFSERHVITRALGTRSDVEVDVQVSPALPGDVFLLASDGLEVLGPDDIRACLQLPPAAAVDRLIARSLAAGAPDNVTVIVARVGDAERPLKRRSR
jgi:serine/threonine protein phosphatase PrpC